jgi:uncharacterized membrane protein (DUF2068 family)
MHTRPQPVTIGFILLVLLSLLNFISPFLPTDYPTIVLFLGGALGVAGLLAAAGLWMLRRWALLLTITVSVLNLVLSVPGIVAEPQAGGKLLAGVTTVGFTLIIVLVMRANSRRAFAAS